MSTANIRHDERISKLEAELQAHYLKRRGRHVVADWFWCFDCGAVKTTVFGPKDKESGPHCRDGRCPACQEVRRGRHQIARHIVGEDGTGPSPATAALCTEEELATYRREATEAWLYEPADGVAMALKRRGIEAREEARRPPPLVW